MNEMLEKGFRIKTLFGKTVTVESFLGEGGQGSAYLVDYDGQEKVLKWYKKGSIGISPNKFYENIQNNVKNGSPSEEFLWPLDISEWVGGTFGYIMDLRPNDYYELTDFMLCHVRFRSYKAAITAALHIARAFYILHAGAKNCFTGLSYQDLNDGNFFINPSNGRVLICDNDNVAPNGTDTGIIGKPRYMAPEIVLQKSKPNDLSDRFSMSVILYILFCLNHPLEGKRYLVPALTPALQEKLYGSEPLFMMDPDDHSNEPHPVIHKNSIIVWSCLPDYIKKTFLKAFSKEAFEKPSQRPTESEWIGVLSRFRSDIVACPCGNEIFFQDGKPCKCEVCGRVMKIPFKLELSEYNIPAIKGSRIYRCQLGVCDPKEVLAPVAQVVDRGNGKLGIKNMSGKHWNAVTTKGENRKVAPDLVIPLKDGIKFTAFGEPVTIREK